MNSSETIVPAEPALPPRPFLKQPTDKDVLIFRKGYSQKAINTFICVLIIIQVINIRHPLPLIWIATSSITAYCFFHYLHKFSKRWSLYPDEVFKRRLFKQAFLIRAVVVVIMYLLFYIMTGQPFEFEAADSGFYNWQGNNLSDYMLDGNFDLFDHLYYLQISDMGYPIFLGFVYIICFKSILLARMFNVLVGAWMCVLIYDLARRNFNEQVGRLAGIMAMLVPNLIYYCGLTLKETLMSFLVVAVINLADKVLRLKHLRMVNIILLVLAGTSLFFFRTVLGISVILALSTSVLIISNRVSNNWRRIIISFWVLAGVIVIFNTTLGDAINKLYAQSETNQEEQMNLYVTRKGGNAFAKYGSKGIFLPMILIAPFPTMVHTNQDNSEMMSGGFYTRNVYAFFAFVALGAMYKRKTLRKHALIITPLCFYLLIIGSSGFALSERFHLPILSFIVILAAYGVSQMNQKMMRRYIPYLIFVSLVIIGWNWFKLAGRGLF